MITTANMKRLLLGAGLCALAIAKPLNTCNRQAQCAEFQVFKSPKAILCDGMACEFEVCLRFYDKPGGSCPSSISHTCKKPVLMCRDPEMQGVSGFPKTNAGFPFAQETLGPKLEFSDCQVVGPNQLVEFLVKDGSGCTESTDEVFLTPSSGIGGAAVCAPRSALTESCTGNEVRQECVWTYHTPNCDLESGSKGGDETEIGGDETKTGGDKTEIGDDETERGGDESEISANQIEASKITVNTQPDPPGTRGDPHFRTWTGEAYDFHGICDLVLLHNPRFQEGLGMDINVRTKKMRQWSYVSVAVLRIGEDTLEVSGRTSGNSYWVNGVEGDGTPFTISGYPVTIIKKNSQTLEYIVGLDLGEKIVIKVWHDFVRVDIKTEDSQYLAGSVGLMGAFPTGEKLARDHKTIIADMNEFGQEWQVRIDEPMLFRSADGIQAPMKCEIPSKSAERRNLGESNISLEDARIACSRVASEDDRDLCIFDVMATNDKEVAGAY